MTTMYLSVQRMVADAREKLSALESAIEAEQEKIRLLRELGITRAGVWWKAGKYLYLIHPSDGFGYRHREYVGADPEKVKAALDSIQRATEHDEAKARLDRLTYRLNTFKRYTLLAIEAARIPGENQKHW